MINWNFPLTGNGTFPDYDIPNGWQINERNWAVIFNYYYLLLFLGNYCRTKFCGNSRFFFLTKLFIKLKKLYFRTSFWWC